MQRLKERVKAASKRVKSGDFIAHEDFKKESSEVVIRKKLPILWDRLARESLDGIYEYILHDSLQNARKVKKELIKLAGSLSDFPDKYSREEFLKEEPENYRSDRRSQYFHLKFNSSTNFHTNIR